MDAARTPVDLNTYRDRDPEIEKTAQEAWDAIARLHVLAQQAPPAESG